MGHLDAAGLTYLLWPANLSVLTDSYTSMRSMLIYKIQFPHIYIYLQHAVCSFMFKLFGYLLLASPIKGTFY